MLPISRYEIYFEADSEVSIPNPPGLLWHGVFGKALHDVSCSHPNLDCATCLRLYDCDYPVLFKPALPPGSQIMTKHTQIPPPHLFQSADAVTEHNEFARVQRTFSVEVTLIGKANERLVPALQAMQQLGHNGIGKKRIPAKVTGIKRLRQGQPPQWLHESDNDFDLPEVVVIPELNSDIKVKFISPYSPPGKRSPAPEKFDLSAFLMGVIRRIDLLSYFYGEKKLDAEFKRLKALSVCGEGVDTDLKISRFGHFSARQSEVISKNALAGGFSLSKDVWSDFWPYLYVGQFLNCGKKASYGMGQYECS